MNPVKLPIEWEDRLKGMGDSMPSPGREYRLVSSDKGVRELTGFMPLSQVQQIEGEIMGEISDRRMRFPLLYGKAPMPTLAAARHDALNPQSFRLHRVSDGERLPSRDDSQRDFFLPSRASLMQGGKFYEPGSDLLRDANELIFDRQTSHAYEHRGETISEDAAYRQIEADIQNGRLFPVAGSHADAIRARGYGNGDHPCRDAHDIDVAMGRTLQPTRLIEPQGLGQSL